MFSRILIALDGSQPSGLALDAALNLAAVTHAVLKPLYVLEFPIPALDAPGYDPTPLRSAMREEGQLVLRDAGQRCAARGLPCEPEIAELAPFGENVAQCIERTAATWSADLIVMGTHGRRGFQLLMLGSVADRVLRQAARPVLLIPARSAPVAEAATTAAAAEQATQDRPATMPS